MDDHTKIDISVDPQTRRMVGVARHGMIPFDVPFISKIADNLWQGGCEDGLLLPTHINFILSLYPWERYQINHKMREERYVRMYDDPNQATNQVDELATLVNEWRKRGQVLVHCQAGLNRSSLIVARALMLEGMTADEAIETLRDKRSPACLCNPGFEGHLRSLDPPGTPGRIRAIRRPNTCITDRIYPKGGKFSKCFHDYRWTERDEDDGAFRQTPTERGACEPCVKGQCDHEKVPHE